MSEATQQKSETPYSLATFLERFASDNKRSYSVENRWLADQINEWLRVTRAIAYGHSDKKIKQAVAEFRLTEIEGEKKKLQAQADELSEEAENLARDTAA